MGTWLHLLLLSYSSHFEGDFFHPPVWMSTPPAMAGRHAKGPSKSGVHDMADFHKPSRGQGVADVRLDVDGF